MEIPDLAAKKTADNLGVDAILWVGGVGNNGTEAIGRILDGTVNPSGHTSRRKQEEQNQQLIHFIPLLNQGLNTTCRLVFLYQLNN